MPKGILKVTDCEVWQQSFASEITLDRLIRQNIPRLRSPTDDQAPQSSCSTDDSDSHGQSADMMNESQYDAYSRQSGHSQYEPGQYNLQSKQSSFQLFDQEDNDYEEYEYHDDYEEDYNAGPPIDAVKFDNKSDSIREINISQVDLSNKADELIPRSYKDVRMYGYFLKLPKRGEEKPPVERKKIEPIRMLEATPGTFDEYTYPFSKKRKYYTMTTMVAAGCLAAASIYLSTEALSTVLPKEYSANLSEQFKYNTVYLNLPHHQFGGFTGGLRGEVSRRAIVAEGQQPSNGADSLVIPGMVPVLAGNTRSISSHKTKDPFGGFGPPQFNPALINARSASIFDDGQSPSSNKVTLTSKSLTSYNPPAPEGGPTIVMDPHFHGSMMDVAYLPYNPEREIPVFWDVPMTGGERIQHVFGYCLKLVQCSEIGSELLEREFRETMQHTVKNKGSIVLDDLSNFDPPLKTDFVRSSNFVNVDCSSSTGVDRGIKKELATSNLVDVIYSRNIMDGARLFLPPIEAYGRGIVILRNPVERIVALYEYLKEQNGQVKNMSLEQFVRSGEMSS